MDKHQDIRQNTDAADDSLKWKPVSTEHVVQDKWIDFRRMAFELPDGTVFSPYYNFSRRSYVVIVASDEEGRYLCVRQYRHGIGEVTTEFVAGGIECDTDREYLTKQDTITSREDALEAAKRELEEETGYTSDEWEPRSRTTTLSSTEPETAGGPTSSTQTAQNFSAWRGLAHQRLRL